VAADRAAWSVDVLPPDARRRLAHHEAKVAAQSGRRVVELNDGFLVVDASGAESWRSWAGGLDWPADTDAFDRRLGELITLFGMHDRKPSIRVDAVADRPADLDRRLHRHGFRPADASLRMWLPADRLDTVVRFATPATGRPQSGPADSVDVALLAGPAVTDLDATDPSIDDAIAVMAAAFGVAPRRGAELRAGASGTTIGLVRAGGIAVAAGRSAYLDGAAYLSAIAVDPLWRRRGFGRIVTAALAVAAIRYGAAVVHLNVDPANTTAWKMYSSLGFLAASPATVRFVLDGR
jgi:ribosomal protein S18 acetylase RimI-like enzyme